MGFTTRISDYSLAQATTVGPEAEGVEVEVKAKVVAAPKKDAPKKTTGAQSK